MNAIERHNWSESDEKSLVSTVKWVNKNIPKEATKDRGGKWKVIAGLLFTDIGLKVSDHACRKRHSNIKNRLLKRKDNDKEILTQMGFDFPQVKEQTETERLKARVSTLERKIDNLIISLNEFSGVINNLSKIADAVNKNTAGVAKKVGKEHWHNTYQFGSRTSGANY